MKVKRDREFKGALQKSKPHLTQSSREEDWRANYCTVFCIFALT